MDSVLDLFLLALAETGVSTYSLLRDAGLSVGATHPALRRLERHNFLRREIGARRKSLFRLTALGREFLKKSIPEAIRAALEHPPKDTESTLRVALLAELVGKRRQTKEVLAGAAAERQQRAASLRRQVYSERAQQGSVRYRQWLRACELARLSAEAKVLRRLTF